MTVRTVERGDIDAVVALVHELATYEQAPEQCRLTVDQLDAALFAEHPAVFGHVAEVDSAIVGCALWFLTYSTWDGVHGVHIEDLYVRPEHRGAGHGRALLEALAAVCRQRGYTRLERSVLDWNDPAIGFYRRLGAIALDEWTTYRLAGTTLAGGGLA